TVIHALCGYADFVRLGCEIRFPISLTVAVWLIKFRPSWFPNYNRPYGGGHPMNLSWVSIRSTLSTGGILMLRRVLVVTLATTTLLFAGLLVANAQTGQLRGSVLVTGADGKPGPGAGALIDVYRTDISGEFHTKADKKGEWVFAGLPLVGTYVVSISAPGGQPQAIGGVRVLNETPVQVTLSAGDGRRLTADEAKKIAAGVRPSAGAGGGGGGGGGRESAEDKAKREEIERKNKEITEQNEKNKNI